jgi:hypothetical protein
MVSSRIFLATTCQLFNPAKHIDSFATIILPGILLLLRAPLFGYAEPVPINFRTRGYVIKCSDIAAASSQ